MTDRRKFDNGIIYEIVPPRFTRRNSDNEQRDCPYCSTKISVEESICPNCNLPVPEKNYLREVNFSGRGMSIDVASILHNIANEAEEPPPVAIKTFEGNELHIKPIMTEEKFVNYYPSYENRINVFCTLRNFTVIDFETANMYPDSVCQMGIVVVEDNNVVEKRNYMIRPPYNDFRNSKIHGITLDDVREAKTFFELWSEIKPFIENRLVGAYNSRFDIGCLLATLENFGLEKPDFAYFDILQSVKEKYEFGSYKLATVSKRLRIKYTAHDALSDALTAATVQIKCGMTATYSFMYAKCNNHIEVMTGLFTRKELLSFVRKKLKEITSSELSSYEKALSVLQMVEEREGDKASILKLRGEIFERCGMNVEALNNYEEAYRLNEKIGVKGKIQKLKKKR